MRELNVCEVQGLPDQVAEWPGVDVLGQGVRRGAGVTLLRHGEREGVLLQLADAVQIYDGNRLLLGDVSINTQAMLHIGARSIVNVGCYLSGEGGLQIGEEVLIGPQVRIFSAGHAIHGGEARIFRNALTYARVTIGDGAWIGGGATVLPGVTIGEGAVVGAGSVVSKDVPPFAVVAGVPARLLHYRAGFASPDIPSVPQPWWRRWF